MKRVSFSSLAALTVTAATTGLLVTACGEDTPGIPGAEELLEECGLTCNAEALAEADYSITGNARIDGFFSAVGTFETKANLVAANIKAELDALRATLELDADASGADIVAAIKAKYELEGDIRIKVAPPECKVSASATVEATAKCDASVDPGMVKAECSGSCTVEASAMVDCGANAELKCEGTAPSLACEGTCTGSCELEAAATCEGTCNGTCSGTCSVENADGSCAGSCDGMCEGSCELKAGGSCSGKCEGSCEFTPPSGMCEGGVQAKCEAMGNASVECEGSCDAEVTPPSASAECEAQVKAEAEANAECTPPGVEIDYGFSASASADVQAEFRAFLVTFEARLGAIFAALKQADFVLEAGANLGTAATGAVQGSIEATIDGEADAVAVLRLGCAIPLLPKVATVVTEASGNLTAQVNASFELSQALGGPSSM